MSVLHAAAARGDLRTAEQLLATGVDPNRKLMRDGATPLITVAGDRRAGADMLRLLVKQGADPFRTTTDWQQTALHRAAQIGMPRKVDYLLSLGLDIDQRDTNGYSPMMLAGFSSSPEKRAVIATLIQRGANPYRVTRYNETAIGACANDFETLQLFERERVIDILRWTPLMTATVFGTVQDMRTALRHSENLRLQDRSRRTVWHLAIETGDVAKARLVYSIDAMPMGDDVGTYPNIFYAVQHNHREMLAWLMDIGADIYARSRLYSALEYAAQHSAMDCMHLLLENGTWNTDTINNSFAIAANTQMLEQLLEAGASIDHVNSEGISALITAIENGDQECVRWLLEHNADPNEPLIGETSLIRAVSGDHIEIVQLLLSAGADVNRQTNPDMWFALQYVRSEVVMQILLDAGADRTLTDAGGVTAHRELWDKRLVSMLEQRT